MGEGVTKKTTALFSPHHPFTHSPLHPIISRTPSPFSQPRIRIPCLSMPSVCFYFQVHQPLRLRRYSVFDTDRHYFDDHHNAEIIRKVANKCYLPANRTMLETIRGHEGRFKTAFSISGVTLEQFEKHAP